jgi:hypothetical protein
MMYTRIKEFQTVLPYIITNLSSNYVNITQLDKTVLALKNSDNGTSKQT